MLWSVHCLDLNSCSWGLDWFEARGKRWLCFDGGRFWLRHGRREVLQHQMLLQPLRESEAEGFQRNNMNKNSFIMFYIWSSRHSDAVDCPWPSDFSPLRCMLSALAPELRWFETWLRGDCLFSASIEASQLRGMSVVENSKLSNCFFLHIFFIIFSHIFSYVFQRLSLLIFFSPLVFTRSHQLSSPNWTSTMSF